MGRKGRVIATLSFVACVAVTTGCNNSEGETTVSAATAAATTTTEVSVAPPEGWTISTPAEAEAPRPVDTASLPEDTAYVTLSSAGTPPETDVTKMMSGDSLSCKNSKVTVVSGQDVLAPNIDRWAFVGYTEIGALVAERERTSGLVRAIVSGSSFATGFSQLASTYVITREDGERLGNANFCTR